jgi:hypothetical protein
MDALVSVQSTGMPDDSSGRSRVAGVAMNIVEVSGSRRWVVRVPTRDF